MNEHKMLSALSNDRDCYEQLKHLLEDGDFSDRGQVILKEIKEFYNHDHNATHIDKDLLTEKFEHDYPKHFQVFKQIIDGLEDVSVPNVISLYLEFKKDQIEQKIAYAFLGNDEATKGRLLQEYNDVLALDQEEVEGGGVHQGTSLKDLAESFQEENLIKVYPKLLNDILGGGVTKQTHILIYAYTEVGKSLWGVNMASGFLFSGRKVLYVGNEDPTDLMLMRFYSRLTQMARYDLLKDVERAESLAKERGYDNLVFAPADPGTPAEIENLIQRHEPEIIVVDQLSNLHIKKSSKVELLEQAAKEVRKLCKRYDVTALSLAQGADTAENKRFLDVSDVYYSNVGVQGQTDVMIGVGMDEEFQEQNKRGVSICKNKITARHDHFVVSVDPHLSKVVS